jgi:hypothetical protein
MVGLQRSAGDQGLRALVARFCHKKFQFTRFVTAEGEPGLVVTFDQQTWPVQSFPKSPEFFYRCRKVSEMQS